MTTLTIGQILYSYSLKEYEVEKIGKKYFECKDHRGKFTIETLKQVSEYSGATQLYLNKQELLDMQETKMLESKLRTLIGQYGKTGLTLEQLRDINKIITQ